MDRHEVSMVTRSYGRCRSSFLKCLADLLNLLQGACQPEGRIACLAAVLTSSLVVLAGCSPRYHDMPEYWPIPTREHDNYGPGRFKTAYLASQIDRYYRGSTPGPIGVTTFVNIDDLYTTSTFGRMVSEQLMSELAMHGFDVVELRHTEALQFLDSSGEFALSRDVRTVRPERNLAAVVVGTYVTSPERVYLNARLIDPATSLVLSAGSVEMSKTYELAKLLRGGSLPGSLERIPVRHLGQSAFPINPFDQRRKMYDLEESEFAIAPGYASPGRPEAALPPPPAAKSKPRAPVITNDVREPTQPSAPLPPLDASSLNSLSGLKVTVE